MIRHSVSNYRMEITWHSSSVRSDGTRDILATVLNLISLVVEDTGKPIAKEEVRYGLWMQWLLLQCPAIRAGTPHRDWQLAARWLLGMMMLLTVPSLPILTLEIN